MMNLLRRALRNASMIIWAVNLIHLTWGVYFFTTPLPMPFDTIHSFSSEGMQNLWAIAFIVVALMSIASDFFRGTWGTLLLIPQQLIVLYGMTEIIKAIVLGDPTNLLLPAMCFMVPVAIMHTVAVIVRGSREQQQELTERIRQFVEE